MTIKRYRGYIVTIHEFGGMYQATVETPTGYKRTGYRFELEYALRAAERIIDEIEDAPPAEFGAGAGGE